jgi:hypothetical protein
MAQVRTTDLIGKKESVVDEILLLNPHTTPMISLLGFGAPVTQVEHVWYEDELLPVETTVSNGGAAVLASATNIKVASVEPFRIGQIVSAGEELMKVTGVNADSIDVTRGYANTTPANIADGAPIEVLYNEGAEGAMARDARYKQRVRKSNLTQIFDDSIEVSGTASVVPQYGVADLYEYEKDKVQKLLALQLEKAIINGIRFEQNQIRQMEGVRSFVKTNVKDAAGADLTLDMFSDVAQKVYEAGGFAGGGDYYIIAPATQKRKISGLSNEKVEITQAERLRGQVVDGLVTDFGTFPVLLNNNLKSDEILFVDRNRMAIRPLVDRAFFHKYLGDQGDFEKGMIVGEYTLEFMEEKAHGRIKGLKTT